MGPLEVQILQCLIVDGRASFRRIGEVVGASEQTVARRYRAMREAGQVQVTIRRSGYAGDRRAWWVRIRCRPDAAEPLAEALAARDESSWVALVSGGSEVAGRITESVDGSAAGLLDRVPRSAAVLSFSAYALLRPFAGGRDEWTMFDPPLDDEQVAHLLSDRESKPSESKPSEVRSDTTSEDEDRPLLASLARDGRATVAGLSRQLGWSPSRVSERLASLLDGGRVFVATDFLPETFGFHVTALVQLTVPPARIVEVGEALASHPETGFVAATTGTTNLLAVVTCRTFDDLFGYMTGRLGGLADIQQVELVPYRRRVKQSTCRVVDGRLVVPDGT